jgi:hypothetical protein
MKFSRIFLTALIALVAGAAFSQQGSFDFHVADMKIVQLKAIQKELGITEAQRNKMNAAADAERASLTAEYKRTKGKPDDKVMIGYYRTLRTKVLNMLSPAQMKRLRELTLQETGLVSLANGEVAARVGISAPELKKIRASIVSHQKQFESIEAAAKRPVLQEFKAKKPKSQAEGDALKKQFSQKMQSIDQKLRPQVTAIMTEGTNQILAALTPAQKAAWKVLLGKPFTGH